jgi:hypothetical protein
MVREERLELSHPEILEPKSSASTNSATLANLTLINTHKHHDHRFKYGG